MKAKFILLCLLAIIPASSGAETPFCKFGKPVPVPVILGGVRYDVPIELHPLMIGEDGKGIIPQKKWFCVAEDKPDASDFEPYKIAHFTIHEGSFIKYGAKYKMLPVQIIIDGKGKYRPTEDYCNKKRQVDKEIVSWDSFKEDPNFMLGHSKPYRESQVVAKYYLYSEKYRFLGYPVLMSCNPVATIKSDLGFQCDYTASLNDKTYLYVRLRMLKVPSERIGKMFAGLESFLQKVTNNSFPKADFTSCDSIPAKGE